MRADHVQDDEYCRWRLADPQVGLAPHTVTAYERSDKPDTLWLRWTSLDKSKKSPDKMSLGYRLRDDRGRIDPDRKAYNRILKGEDPRTREPEKDETGERQDHQPRRPHASLGRHGRDVSGG